MFLPARLNPMAMAGNGRLVRMETWADDVHCCVSPYVFMTIMEDKIWKGSLNLKIPDGNWLICDDCGRPTICKSTARRSYFYTNPKWVDSRCVDQLAPQESEFGDQAEKLLQFQGFKNENSCFWTAQKQHGGVLLNHPETTGPCHHPRGTFESSRWFSGFPTNVPLSEVIGQPSKARNWNSDVSLFFRSIRIERNMLTQKFFFLLFWEVTLAKYFYFSLFPWNFFVRKNCEENLRQSAAFWSGDLGKGGKSWDKGWGFLA